MAQQNTSLNFTATGSLYPTGNVTPRYLTTDKSLVLDLSQSKKLSVSALNTDISATLYLDAIFGFEIWVDVGTTGTYSTEFDLELDVGLPSAVITPERAPGDVAAGAVMEFDFTKFDISRGELSSVGFGRVKDTPIDPVAKSGIDLHAAFAAGVRDAGFYGPIPGGIDNFDLPDIRFFGFNYEKDLALLGLSNTVLTRVSGDDPFKISASVGSILSQKKLPAVSKILKALGEIEFSAPTGANTFGSSSGSAQVDALGLSSRDFLNWSIDADRLILTLLDLIPEPRVKSIVKILKNTVFLEKTLSVGGGLDFLIKVLDLTSNLTVGVSEKLSIDLNRAGTNIPGVNITLVSDNGTPDNPNDDRTTTGKLGEKLQLLSPTTGFGTAKIDATFTVDQAQLTHELDLKAGAYFRVDLLQGRFTGSLVPSALEFDFGPIFSKSYTIAEGTLGPGFKETFTIPGSQFNAETDTYEVFWVEDRLAPTDWDADAPTFADDFVDYFEAGYDQLDALFAEYDTTGFILEPETVPDDLIVTLTELSKPVLFGWTGFYDVRVIYDGVPFLDGSRVLVGPRPVDKDGEEIVTELTVTGKGKFSAGYPDVVGPVRYDDDLRTKYELLDRTSEFNMVRYDYKGKYVETTRGVDVIGNEGGDVLFGYFIGLADGYFDGGGNNGPGQFGTYDTFIADLSFTPTAVHWDLRQSINLENDLDNTTMGGVTLELHNGRELIDITIKNVEAAMIKTGSGDDYLVGGRRSDVFETGDGDDIVRLAYYVEGDRPSVLTKFFIGDMSDDYVRLGKGKDTAIVEFGLQTSIDRVQSTDYIFGGEGADSVYIRSGQMGLRYDIYDEFTSGTPQYLFGGKGLGADAQLGNIGVLIKWFNDDYADNFGVYDDIHGLRDDDNEGFRSETHYLIMNGEDNGVDRGGRAEISKDVEYINVYTSPEGLFGDGEGTGRGDDLVLFMNGTIYEGGAGQDTFAGDFTSIDIYSGTRGGLNFWVDAAASYFGETVITGFERAWIRGTRESDVIAGGALDDYIDGGNGNDFIFGGFDTAADLLFGGAGDDVILWQGNGNDVLDGGQGRDTLYIGNFDSPIDGTESVVLPETGYSIKYYDADGDVIASQFAGFQDPVRGHEQFLEMLTLARTADQIGITAAGDQTLKFSNVEAINMKGTDFASDLMVYHGGTIYDAGERLDGKDKDTFAADFRFAKVGLEIVIPEVGPKGDQGYLLQNGVFIKGFEQLMIAGGRESDILAGGDFADVLLGGGGDDVLSGRGGNDYLDGGEGSDQLFWDSQGKDTIVGGTNASPDDLEFDNLIINGGSGDSRVVLIDENGDDILSSRKGQAWTDSSREVLQELAENSLTADTWKYYNTTPGNPNNREDRSLRHVTYSEMESVDIAGTDAYDEVLVFQNGVAYVGGERDGDGDLFVGDMRAFSTDLFFNGHSASGDGYDIGQGTQIADIERFHVLLGSGDDTVLGNDMDDTVHGGGGNDWFSGGLGDDEFLGQGGNDTFEHSGGKDTYDGGAGRDVLNLNARSHPLTVVLFNDVDAQISTNLSMEQSPLSFADLTTVFGLRSDIVITEIRQSASKVRYSNVEEVLVSGSQANDVLIGASLRSGLFGGAGDDALIGLEGNDFMSGGTGADIYAFGTGFGKDIIHGETEANTLIVFVGYGDGDLGFSLDGIDLLVSADGNTLRILDYFADDKNVGNNFTFHTTDGSGKRDFTGLSATAPGAAPLGTTELGTEGDDRPTNGTAKSDVFRGFGGDDFFTATGGGDLFDGGAGVDAVSYFDALGRLQLDLSDFVAKVTDERNDYLVSIERVLGTKFNDNMSGNTHNNALNGAEGDDLIKGKEGADTLIGGDGDDTLEGGADDDDLSGDNGNDSLSGGDGNDILRGGAGADNLSGGAQDDILDGGLGKDTLNGGSGDDTLFYGGGLDIMNGGQGRDLVDFSILNGKLTVVLDGSGDTFFDPAGTAGKNNKIAEISGIEDVYGSQGNDLIIGNAANNTLDGYLGNDTLVGGKGDDDLHGDAGFDTIDYSRENGTTGVDVDLRKDDDSFAIDSYGDRDQLVDIERVIGTEFSDYMQGNNGADVFFGEGGDDRLSGRSGDDEIDGGAGDDTISGGEGDDTLIGGGGDDFITGDKGDDTFIGGEGGGTDSYDGGVGFDIVSYERTTKGVSFSIGQFTATGEEVGVDKFDDIEAYAGGKGDDDVNGSGNGDYYFYIGGKDNFDARGGRDTLDFSRFDASVMVDLAAGSDAQTSDGTTAPDQNLRSIVSLSSVEDLRGTDFDDILVGNAAANRLHGGKGDDLLDGGKTVDKDELYGGDGNDVLVGWVGAGVDLYDGGSGSDVLDYSGQTSAVIASLETGDGNDKVLNVEWLLGTDFADTLLGNDESNILVGGKGRDRILTGAGADIIVYTSGIDTVSGGEDSDTLDFAAYGAAIDLDLGNSESAATSGGKQNFDKGTQRKLVRLPELDVENAIGTDFNDRLRGTDGANILAGGKGDDTVLGEGGDDILIYDAGLDSWEGGAGRDTGNFAKLAEGVLIDLNDRNATVLTRDGLQTILVKASGIEDVVGTQFDDVIIGDDNANILDGLTGNDTLKGSKGDDTLAGSGGDDVLNGGEGADMLDGGEGLDTASYADASKAIIVDLGTGTDGEGEAKGDTFKSIENIEGTDFADTITGDAGHNLLVGGKGADNLKGGDGDDTLEGGQGADKLDGGIGTDLASYSSAKAAVTVNLGNASANTGVASGDSFKAIEGLIGSQFDDTLTGDTVDNILMGGKGKDTLNGNRGADTLFGGADKDKLDGGTGADALYGGSGNDKYFVDDIRDRAFEEKDGGKDTVVATSDHVLSAYVENLIFKGGDALNGFGNDGNNNIVGNGGDNTLQGLAGNDTINGKAGNDYLLGGDGNDNLNGAVGNDVLTGDAGKDVFQFTKTFGNDTITDFQVGEDLIRFTAGNGEAKTFNQFAGAARDTAIGVEYDLADDGTNVLVLTGVTLASLSKSDFDFT